MSSLILLFHLAGDEQMSEKKPLDSIRVQLETAIKQYEKALDDFKKNGHSLLDVLIARDQIQSVLRLNKPYGPDQLQRLIKLDGRLREQIADKPLQDLANLRQTLCPSDKAWWWFLDQKAEKLEKGKELPWVLLAGTFLLFTVTLSTEIVRRFWDGAPDLYSIFGTLIILLLTSSPLFKRGQELAKWSLQHIPFLKPRLRAHAMAGMSWIAFTMVLIVWLLLPKLAIWYNNRGIDALLVRDNMADQRLRIAQLYFSRAIAINPEQIVAYQNQADVYRCIGFLDEALNWYRKAIERDLNFGPGYYRCSQIYNEQGKFKLAEKVALGGLQEVQYTREEKAIAMVTRYALLSNLGWAYFGQQKYELAQRVLEEAVRLENELKKLSEGFRWAIPHYYLAKIYEQQNRSEDAKEQWGEALRFLKEDKWADHEWLAVVKTKLKNP